MDLYNGQVTTATYNVADNAGHSQNFTLVPNLNSGNALVGIAATGTQITVADVTGSGSWDFAIDNITFDQPLPPSLSTPDGGATVGLLAMGLIAIGLFARKASPVPAIR